MFDINLTEDSGKTPRLTAPPKACDTHSHVMGSLEKYPQKKNLKPRFAPVETYRAMLDRIGIERCVIVQSSYYGNDNRCTLDAIAAIGQDRARGTAVIAPGTTEKEIKQLHEAGMRGVRVSEASGDLTPDDAPEIARLIAPYGWALQVQRRVPGWIEGLAPTLKDLPVPLIFDHLGRTPAKEGADSAEFKAMLKLFEGGNVWIKLSGFYYTAQEAHPGYADLRERIRILCEARPDRLLWGLNWPFPDFPGPGEADSADFLDPLLDFVPDAATRKMIFADNPGKLYGFDS
jgi:predicted TIM-barrel fold metal-dependent hydrolase